GQQPTIDNPVLWIVYAAIFAYYIASTVFPIDKIIGKVYPIFGAILVLSALGIFGGVLLDGGVNLTNLSLSTNIFGQHPSELSFFPVFFITVACGIMSGFHSTQSTLISRTVTDEREGRSTFFNMMLVEGFIAMVWAAGAMVLFNLGTAVDTNATLMVGMISRHFLGNIGALFAILGVIVLPITSGDTAFRSLRLTLAETFNIDQSTNKNRMGISVIIFAIAAVILVYSKSSPGGFSLLWRYFGFTNQLIAVFALAMIAIYLAGKNKNYWISLLPGVFYCMVVVSYILHEPIGFGLESRIGYLFGLDPNSYSLSLILGAIIAIIYGWVVMKAGKKRATNNLGKLNL
ncbi:MAG: carbon starvation CstA 5TM domain-containing protein, partial [Bacillus sp. (in: firmicutes)]